MQHAELVSEMRRLANHLASASDDMPAQREAAILRKASTAITELMGKLNAYTTSGQAMGAPVNYGAGQNALNPTRQTLTLNAKSAA